MEWDVFGMLDLNTERDLSECESCYVSFPIFWKAGLGLLVWMGFWRFSFETLLTASTMLMPNGGR